MRLERKVPGAVAGFCDGLSRGAEGAVRVDANVVVGEDAVEQGRVRVCDRCGPGGFGLFNVGANAGLAGGRGLSSGWKDKQCSDGEGAEEFQ